jgi:hypothetical protein
MNPNTLKALMFVLDAFTVASEALARFKQIKQAAERAGRDINDAELDMLRDERKSALQRLRDTIG